MIVIKQPNDQAYCVRRLSRRENYLLTFLGVLAVDNFALSKAKVDISIEAKTFIEAETQNI